ncbi:hypothetical protein PIB30_007376 [Stylosanthes scabra]|uniref:Myb/SANT-like domain-containing protein n=1 Tax=Stylosanthes scabra TaxID=79078 RepID=A0ABU6Z6I3_9FABA|nr:hypothetical protein [Stylosanthes scabra]
MQFNKVNAPLDVWEDMYTKGRYYKQFKKSGFEWDYEILGEIFNNSTASGQLSHASTKEPPTSDEEKLLEKDFLSKGVHVDGTFVDVYEDVGYEKKVKRRKLIESSGERRRKESKNARSDKFDDALEKWTESVNARIEISKSKTERYNAYSIEACIEVLNSMENVSRSIYNKAVTKFVTTECRCIFMTMPAARRMEWLNDLD